MPTTGNKQPAFILKHSHAKYITVTLDHVFNLILVLGREGKDKKLLLLAVKLKATAFTPVYSMLTTASCNS